MAQEIVHRDSAKTAPHCKGFVRSWRGLRAVFMNLAKAAPIWFGSSINARSGLFDGLFDGNGFAAGLMILGRFRRLGIRRPRPRDQSRENCIPNAYDYLDHRADPLPGCLCGGCRPASRRKFGIATGIPNFWEVVLPAQPVR